MQGEITVEMLARCLDLMRQEMEAHKRRMAAYDAQFLNLDQMIAGQRTAVIMFLGDQEKFLGEELSRPPRRQK